MLDRYLEGDAPILDGFFLTGDLGRLDERNRLWITGRLKLQIDVGGLKVNPTEVESLLLEHPAVADCVVLPMPISDTIGRVRAIVVPRPSASPTTEELRHFLSARLAPYKIPRVIEFRDTLPRSAVGKVLRREVELSEGP
jgi:long-chain acyl-CoA synthetase